MKRCKESISSDLIQILLSISLALQFIFNFTCYPYSG